MCDAGSSMEFGLFIMMIRLLAKEKSMAARKTEAAAGTFLELLQQQIEFLEDEDYAYTELLIFTKGDGEPWEFVKGSELQIDEEQGILVGRDGPTDEQDNEGVPEYVIRLDAIVGSQLIA